jgi:hypothetical protein
MYLGASDNLYVLMTQNSSADRNTQQSFGSEEEFQLQIVMVGTRVNKQVLDNVAGQILQLVIPFPNQQSGLSQQPGIFIDNVYKYTDDYQYFTQANSKNVVRRIITFSQLVTQTSYSGVVPTPPGNLQVAAMFKFISSDFYNSTDLHDAVLAGYNIAVFWDDNQKYLRSDQFTILPNGGFSVLVPGFDSQTHNYTFYVSILSN